MRWVAVTVLAGMVAIIVAADVGALPLVPAVVRRWPGADKVGHVVMFGLLAVTVGLALPPGPARRPWQWLVVAGVVLALLAAAEEWSQTLMPRHTPEWADVGGSLLGIAGGTLVAWARRRRPAWRGERSG